MKATISSLFNFRKKDISNYMPLLSFHDDITMTTKNGNYCRVILVDGIDYTSYSLEDAQAKSRLRMNVLKSIPETIHINFHSLRVHETTKFEESENHTNQIASEIANIWSKKFESTFATQHYIVLTTGKETALDELDILIKNADRDVNRISDLEEACIMVRKLLKELNPTYLDRSGLSTFFGNILNCTNKRLVLPISNFDDYLHESTIEFPLAKPYMTFENGSKRYSMVLSIKFFESDTNTKMLDEILHLKSEFRICQYAQKLSKTTAMNMIKDREKTVQGFMDNSSTATVQLEELLERIQNDEVVLMRYNYTVYCYADSAEECKNTIDDIRSIVHQYGFVATIETSNIEPLFWSQFPTNERYLLRKRYMTNENVSDFQTFSGTGTGLQSCSWGHEPVTKFLTRNGSVYNFVFHESTAPQALGNTLVFGKPGTGKTTLVDFLLSSCQRYPGFKALIFDRLQGTRIFVESHGGSYTDFSNNVELNPLTLKDTKDNRAFLANFFKSLSGLDTIETNATIGKVIDTLYKYLKPEQRTFDNLIDAFGSESESELRLALNEWSSKGSNGNIFTAEKDALEFESDIVAFNMDTLFKDAKALANTMLYISHKFKELTSSGFAPHAIFVDEFLPYLKEPVTVPNIKEWVLELRKLEGIFIAAAQSPNHIDNSEHGKDIVSSFANFIFFADATADENVLKKTFMLNDTEIEWIKYNGEPHQILFKRNGGESVVLNVNLSDLGGYLNLFDSSSTARQKVKELKATSDNWVEELISKKD